MGLWPLVLPFVLLAAAVSVWRDRMSRDHRSALVAYLALNVLYVITVGALMERSENHRFRAEVDPLIWLLLLFALGRSWRLLTFVRANRPVSPSLSAVSRLSARKSLKADS